MKIKATLLILLIAIAANAQQLDKASLQQLYVKDMNINQAGMTVLTGWGAANFVSGVVGFAIADGKEARAFWGMNAIWGAVNAGIGGLGYWGAKKEKGVNYSCDQLLQKHDYYKRLFLLNAGLDVAYIGTGIVLNAYADDFKTPATVHGFGKSIALQGIGLLLFDGTMYTMHQKQDKRWYKLLNGLCITGNGIGYRYALN